MNQTGRKCIRPKQLKIHVMPHGKNSVNPQLKTHLCEDCFFNEIQYSPEKRYHCNLFTKHVPQETVNCVNHATANDVANAIVNHKSFSKKLKTEIISNIILKKIMREQYNAINDAVLDYREISSFEYKFDAFCDKKIKELECGDILISRKQVAAIPEHGWDKVRIYNETRKHQDGTIYVKKIKMMMALNDLSDFEEEIIK